MPTPYDLNLPCLNPQCKSHGQPHPNCRCYGFSEGGEVGHFCSEGRSHKEDCEYYAGGGKVEEKLPSFDEMKAMQEGKAPEATNEALPSFDEMKAMQSGEAPTPQTKEQLPSFDEMKAMQQGGAQVVASAPPQQPDTTEQLKAAAEGASQGLIGDFAKVIQVKSGISTLEDIERREQEFPTTHAVSKGVSFAGSLLAGPGKAITAAVGSKLLGNVVAATAYSLSDNTAKAFLGQPGGDVGSVVAGTILQGGIEGMMNTAVGGLFESAPKAAKALLNEKTVKAAENFMIDFAEKPVSKALAAVGAKMSGGTGVLSDINEYRVLKDVVRPRVEKIIGKPLTKANQYVGDAVLNALIKTNFFGVPTAIRFAERASGGLNAVTPPIEALFKSTVHGMVGETKKGAVEAISKWMEDGGIDGELLRSQTPAPAPFASGGAVGPSRQDFANLYPTENIMLNQARARVSGYLNSIRPSKNQPKLPFDREVSQKQKEKAYKKALTLAANPLSILNDVNSGTLTTESLGHFKSMWPEAHDFLSNKITERITKAQLAGEMPSYKKRQAMSLFLGVNLDSSFTGKSIATVQGLYAAKQQQQMPQAKGGSKKAVAKSSNQYLTDEQARERRMQNQK